MEVSKENQQRKYYRLITDDADPVYVHFGGEEYKVVDISITGLKVVTPKPQPQWMLEEPIEFSLEFPADTSARMHAVGKICYLDATSLGLEYIKMTSMDKKRISDYVLKITKNQGLW